MAFKPQAPERTGGGGDYEQVNYPTPKSGSRKARVSLIVDLGEQEREPFEEKDGTFKDQKPCHQVAVFADLVADKVDYGGEIGTQQYRLLINKSFKGVVQGINFQGVPQKDADGNILKGKDGKWLPYTLHPASPLTKIAKAAGRDDIVASMDIEQLLNLPFMATVEVKITEDKNGKEDKDGNVIKYKNVNFKGAAQVPLDDDDNPMPIADLTSPAKCITFANATKEDIKVIRANLRKQIKQALNYAGSQMQKAIEAFEAENGGSKEEASEGEKPTSKPAAPAQSKEKAKAAAAKNKPVKAESTGTGFDDMDDDIPF